MKTIVKTAFYGFIAVLCMGTRVAAQTSVKPAPLDEVRLLEGPFAQAQEWDHAYILKLEPDRLLAPFRHEAGLPKKAEYYGNWEGFDNGYGLCGHTAGHYLSALAFMYASTGDPEMLKRLNYMVSELADCQRANGDGYVGGVPNSKDFWSKIAAGDVEAAWTEWVPWYNVHKTFAGLRDAWLVCGNEQAKTVLIGLADWCGNVVAHLPDDKMQHMLDREQGGMNEVLADVYAITGDKKYLDLAMRFDHQAILRPLTAHQDELDGQHANTQIPKVIGFDRIGDLTGNQSMCDAAKFFWETVTEHRSVAIGGNSTQEHFNPAKDYSTMLINREGPETCNSYNMLKLSQDLFNAHPEAKYFDFAERVLYNHILTTIDDHGMVYFTSMRPGHYRTYSTPGQSFWCCVGTGMENHGKYGGFVYAEAPGALYVNLFIPSTLNWKEQGVTLRQETKFPDQPRTHFVLKLDKPTDLKIYLRHPGWVKKDAFKVQINGSVQTASSDPSSYVMLKRKWQSGDTIDVELPMEPSLERFPDGSDDVAFLYGPLVLAASTSTDDMPDLYAKEGRSGHIAGAGALLPLDQAPSIVCPSDGLPKLLQPVPGEALTFTLGNAIVPAKFQGLKLVPFYYLPEKRYVIYWQHFTPDQYQSQLDQIRQEEQAAVAMDKETLDRVLPGEQQPEADHHFQGQNSGSGYFQSRHWRDANGWFSYDLKATPGTPAALCVTYWGGDQGRKFSIFVNGQNLAQVQLDSKKPDHFFTEQYPIPDAIVSAAHNGTLNVKFAAELGSTAGGVFDVRLIRTNAQ